MTDSNDPIKSSLETLHSQLNDAQVTTDAQRAHLDEVRQAVRTSIDNPGTEQHATLRDRLEKASAAFDAEHPSLATALHTVINVLADAGF